MSKRKRNPDQSSMLDPSERSFIYDEVDDFHEDKDEDENIYHNVSKVIRDRKPKEHVLSVGGYSDDDDDDEESDDEINNDDESVEGEEESDVDTEDDDKEFENDIYSSEGSGSEDGEDGRSMGKKKKFFFGTDLTDERIHKAAQNRGKKKESDALELEMKGTKELQERMRKEIAAEEDFSHLLLLPQDSVAPTEASLPTQLDKIDLNTSSKLPKSTSLKKLKKASPEIFPLMADFKEKMSELRSKLSPLMRAKKDGLLPPSPAADYLHARYLLCLNYLSVASGYMMLKFSENGTEKHPAEARLAQYKHLFKELEVCKKKFDPELEILLSDLESGKLKRQRRKMLNVVVMKEEKMKKAKRKRKGEEEEEEKRASDEESSAGEEEQEEGREEQANKEIGVALSESDRRKITYQMKKNKGLLPSRKKEQRNPRVKYKKKYQAKLKRRKGQVREVRREVERYGGEISGIKKNLVKSVKFK